MKTSYVFLANGFEEIEALTTIDVMRRAGMKVTTVSIHADKVVTGAHAVSVVADKLFNDVNFDDAEWLVLPGGMPGASNLAADSRLTGLLKSFAADGGKIAAICAAPAVVLAPLGLLNGREATCYPGFEPECKKYGAIMRDTPVCALPDLITGNGPAAAMRFALAIVANAKGDVSALEVGSGMLFYQRAQNFYF